MVALEVASAAERIALPKLAKNEGVSPVTTWRWALRGICGIKLPTVCIGHKRYTTMASYQEWCRQVTAARNGEAIGRASTQRQSAVDRAERETARFGV